MNDQNTLPAAASPPSKKTSSVRHTRAIQRDRSKRPPAPPPAGEIAERLTELIQPLSLQHQAAYYAQRGLRQRVLTLPVLVALVLSLIWQQVGSVSALVRQLTERGVLWTGRVQVSQQALSQRLRVFPAGLFEQVLRSLLPQMQERWQARRRPLPPELAWAQAHFSAVLAADGSTLDALVRKVGLLRDREDTPLAGRMLALLDLCARLPRALWYEEDPAAHDQRAWPQILAALPAGAMLVLDLGFTNFAHYAQLTHAHVTFLTRAKRNLAYQVDQVLQRTSTIHDEVVWIGSGADRQQARLIQVLYQGLWYRYLTNELDSERVPVLYAMALYGQRWRIEDAFNLAKRLLGLAYFWVGSQNGVQLQLWATWILYTVLIDLTDEVADRLGQPLAALSVEMTYQAVFFYVEAYHAGEATDLVAYLAAKAQRLGVLKRQRKHDPPPSRFDQLRLTLAQDP
jgi:hypothetical protein